MTTLVIGYFFIYSRIFFHFSTTNFFSHFNNNLLYTRTNLNLAKLIHKGSHRMSVGKSNAVNAGRLKKKLRRSFEKFSEL